MKFGTGAKMSFLCIQKNVIFHGLGVIFHDFRHGNVKFMEMLLARR